MSVRDVGSGFAEALIVGASIGTIYLVINLWNAIKTGDFDAVANVSTGAIAGAIDFALLGFIATLVFGLFGSIRNER